MSSSSSHAVDASLPPFAPWQSKLHSAELSIRAALVFLLRLRGEVPITRDLRWTSSCEKDLRLALKQLSELRGELSAVTGQSETPSTSNILKR
jgi:hypothetical protein